MTASGGRRRPQKKYPAELRQRAVRMVLEIQAETGEKHGAVTRIAKQLGIGTESLRQWSDQADFNAGRRPGRRAPMRAASPSLAATALPSKVVAD